MWKWAVKRKKNKQGGWWEDGGGTKGIWGKEVNWERDYDGFHRNLPVFHCIFPTTLFGGIVSQKKFEKTVLKEEWVPQASKGRNVFGSVPPWLVDKDRGIILGKCGNSQLVLATQLSIQFLCFLMSRNTISDIKFKALVVLFAEETWSVVLQRASDSSVPAASQVCTSSWLGVTLGRTRIGWGKGAEQLPP